MHDLPLQIGEIDDIAIANGELTDAAGSQIKRCRRPKAAGTDNQRMRLIELFLGLLRPVPTGEYAGCSVAVVHHSRGTKLIAVSR